MIEEINNINSKKDNVRNFGILIGTVLFVISGFFFWYGKDISQLFFIIGIALLLVSITIPLILKPFYWIWMVFATIMGWFMTRVILSALFFVVLTPIGLIGKIFGKKFLNIKWNTKDDTYWIYRSYDLTKERHEKQF